MKQSRNLRVLALAKPARRAYASSFLQPSVRKLRNDNWAFFYLEHSKRRDMSRLYVILNERISVILYQRSHLAS
jgi:hypothetical protein